MCLSFDTAPFRNDKIVSFAFALCLSYFENNKLSFSSIATNFTVVEPTSIPILIMFYTMSP